MKAIQVLLIENDSRKARELQGILSQNKVPSFKVECVETVPEGIERSSQGGVDVVLMASSLPGSQASDTLLRFRHAAPGVPVILLTDFADDELAFEILQKGATDYLARNQVTGDILLRIIRFAIERKRAEEALRESEQRFRRLSEATFEAVLILQQGKVVTTNERFTEMFGYSPTEVTGMSVTKFFAPEHQELVKKNILSGYEESYECVCLRKDGTTFLGELRGKIAPYHGQAAEVASIRNITERKSAEQKIKQQAEELARSNQELEQFAYVASHDLQEPLRKVVSYVELLGKRYPDQLDDAAKKYMGFIVDGALRMRALISDLLSYSRVGRGELALEPTNFATLLAEVLSTLEPTLRGRGAKVTFDPLPTALAHRSQMSEVLQNLIGNATKFRGDDPPRVHVSAVLRHPSPASSSDHPEWVFSVRDNGIGIDPQHSERIFFMFQRLHTQAEYPGTGIGLAICKKVVDRHGGRIWVESQVGKGATFHFTLPVRNGSQGGG